MANNNSRLSIPIEECSNALIDLINSLVPDDDTNYLLNIFDFDKFKDKYQLFEDIIKKNDFDYTVDVPEEDGSTEDSASSLKKAMDNFNMGLDEKTRDFILTMSFQKAAHEFLTKHLENSKSNVNGDAVTMKEKEIELEGYTISREELKNFNKLSILIDFQMYLLIEPYPSIKSSFYLLLSQILQALFNESTDLTSTFWHYMETRKSLIQDRIFDKQVTSDRISFLEICNSLTDKFFQKNIQGKRDLSKKDTFNDTFQYRVRVFIANIFNFEDNTGLNKYFSTSNRIVNDFSTNSRSRDDSFIKDVIQINKLFRDPYYFLKPANHKQFTRIADTLKRVYDYLMEEEISWSMVAPKIDQFVVPTPKSETEELHLKEKYANKLYFPEHYLLAPFDERKRGESFDKLKKQDYSFMSKQFDDSKIRQTCLVQIYFICHLYLELNAANKNVFLKSINGPANIKHFTDDSTPDSLVSLFFKIKREIPKRYRSIDSQFSFLLQHMAIDETFWWSWLIYGKDPKTGKPLFADKVLTAAELTIIQEKTQTIIPFKDKRYFNTYATPQLSRKMKVERGLKRLAKNAETNGATNGFQDGIDLLTEKLSDAKDKQDLNHLVDERNVLTWKHLKQERHTKWLQFGKLLSKLMLGADLKIPEESKASTERTEPTESLKPKELVEMTELTESKESKEKKGHIAPAEPKETMETIDADNDNNIEQPSNGEHLQDTKGTETTAVAKSEDQLESESNIETNSQLNELDMNNESSGTKRSHGDDSHSEDERATKKTKN